MKSHILLLFYLFMILGFHLSAQTLKNIYRHNQPVLHIPTHLIDKVETADVNGERVLKVIQLNGYVSQIPVSQIDSITHNEGQAVDPAQLGNLRTASVMGVVRDTGNVPVNMAIVRSVFSGEVTHTDANGVFFLNNITVYDKLGYITIEKPGYHKGSRSFLPLQQGSNRVNIELLPMALSGSFNSTSGGQITSGLLQLNFPANAIQLNGQSYTGTVNVYAQALDPTSNSMFDQMPGELLGGMNDSLRLLRSFGMASVELRDTNYQLLQLQAGTSASLQFTISDSLLNVAPTSIDWWSFDESQGYWKHEGLAQKQGNVYVGNASHFSWWNCDTPENFVEFHGTVNSLEGNPVSDAQIHVNSPTLGNAISYTNSEGTFCGWVPKNQNLTVSINLFCSSTNNWESVYTEIIASGLNMIIEEFDINLLNNYPISGTVLNCSNQPIVSGYVMVGNQISFTSEGLFSIQVCVNGTYTLLAFDSSNPDTIKVSNPIPVQVLNSSVQLGNIVTCLDIYSTVTDTDGNTYPTILIGNQWWMAENLKTSRFADGTLIPNITNDSEWAQLNTPAWCNYDNSVSNDAVYGKLYNWYSVDDPLNVCPTDWHVPSDAEWNVLIGFLDPEFNPSGLGSQSYTGGSKMKHPGLQYWDAPNLDVTNESGFTGLAGGHRHPINSFELKGQFGFWWSSTFSSTNYAWYRYLRSINNEVGRESPHMRLGYSIRCIKN
ncbi:MAG TPA: FISUMP domain-containing protein [Flavobacteriales bacterium]|nr:FISUMP domain-containing protein [Flavobacteriales bacterium]